MNFNIRQLNSPFYDAAFFVRNLYRRHAFLLDCGSLGNLEHSELLSVRDIFVSHTHMDHFYGFDRVIRGSLVADHEITLYGPPGFIDNIEGKFRGYTWNLVDEYTFSVKAVELYADGNIKAARFSSGKKFQPEELNFADVVTKEHLLEDKVNDKPVINIGEGFFMEYEHFDHRIPSLGFRITEPVRFSIDKDRLADLGEKTGPWLAELKKALSDDKKEGTIDVNGTNRSIKELEERLVSVQKPQSVTYITDCAPTAANVEKAVAFAKNSSILIIESVFLKEDEDHAIQKQHLTMELAKEIFLKSGSELVRFTHFASRYEQEKSSFLARLYDGMKGKIYKQDNK